MGRARKASRRPFRRIEMLGPSLPNANIFDPSARWPERLLSFARQRLAELERAPALVGRVIPELMQARLAGRESWVHVVLAGAERQPERPALVFGASTVTYRELAARMQGAAAWLEAMGVRRGDALGLVSKNSPGAVALLLGAARLGASVALPPPDLDGPSLASALEQAGSSRVFVEPDLGARVRAAVAMPVWELDPASGRPSGAEGAAAPRAELEPGGADDFVYIYTSGTTGSVKPCRVSHRKALLAASAFGRLVHRLRADDVLYCPLPLHHASGLLLGLGACLVAGATLALRARFSASQFLADVCRYDASVVLYVGELGRALLAQPPSPADRRHRLRLALGNGMSRDVWAPFAERFGIREIAEFYAATEFPGAIVNLTGRVGSVGHLPFGRARGYRLVRVDVETGELVRDDQGRATQCGPGEAGELLLRVEPKPGQGNGAYLGYLGTKAGGERIASDLFRAGDRYCRSGDLFRRDASGHYYFVDRLGDTYRYKSENVSTRDVESALGCVEGVDALGVVGVALPNVDGKVGLLLIQAGARFSVAALAARVRALPGPSQPRFLRLCAELPQTASLKLKKRDAARTGVDPAATSDLLYYLRDGRYLPLDVESYRAIVGGTLRL
jgi:fatty-acyl-CoA synthase